MRTSPAAPATTPGKPCAAPMAAAETSRAACERDAVLAVGVHGGLGEAGRAIVRARDVDLLLVLVADVHVLTARHQDGLVGAGVGVAGDGGAEGRAEIVGPGHDRVALVVL